MDRREEHGSRRNYKSMAVVVLRPLRSKLYLICVCLLGSLLVLMPVESTAATMGERFEGALGSSAVPELVKQYGGVYIVPLQERLWLDEVFSRLVEVTERQELEYSLTVLNSTDYNAFALPGGYLFLTKGLLKSIGKDEAKLAAVLGHEIAHVEKKHGLSAVLRQMGLTVLLEVGALWIDAVPPDVLRMASATLLQLLQLGWGREAEYEADSHGQELAIKAGFDGIGAVALLDDLLEMDSADLPMKVFRTHPETEKRRARVAENLATYWSQPSLVTDEKKREMLIYRRSSDQPGRSDPNGRFVVEKRSPTGLVVQDLQQDETFLWLEDSSVLDFAWAPDGQLLAVLVELETGTELWFCDRYGFVVKMYQGLKAETILTDIYWSPNGKMLALQVANETENSVFVTYLETEVYLPVSGGIEGTDPVWLDDGLAFLSKGAWYFTSPPPIREVVVSNPVPTVLQRQRILSPEVIRDGNTIRLTRPSLVLP